MEALNTKDSTLISFENNTIIQNNKAGTCFPPMKHATKGGFPSLDFWKDEQVVLCDPLAPWDPVVGLSQAPLDPMSMMPCTLDCDDMVCPEVLLSTCNTHEYKIDDMIQSHDYIGDFLFNNGW